MNDTIDMNRAMNDILNGVKKKLEMLLAAYSYETKVPPENCTLVVSPGLSGNFIYRFEASRDFIKSKDDILKDIAFLLTSTASTKARLSFTLDDEPGKDRTLVMTLEFGQGSENFGLRRMISFSELFSTFNPRFYILDLQRKLYEHYENIQNSIK